jgi:hypothetical protein
MKELKAAFCEKHPLIADHFGTNIGFELMMVESRIMLGVLHDLSRMGIVALPMHDGVMVPQSKEAVVMQVMRANAMEHAGLETLVERKRIVGLSWQEPGNCLEGQCSQSQLTEGQISALDLSDWKSEHLSSVP